MSTPTFHGETMSPLFGHATEWTLTYDGRPVHVFMHNPHHETPQFVITAMDTHRKFRQTSKRGRGIVALIRDAYAQRFAGLHFDDADHGDYGDYGDYGETPEEAAPEGMEPAEHTAEDSLIYLNNAARILLDLAEDDIHGVYHVEHAVETEDLPEHLAAAVSALRAAARLITAETALHGLNRRRFYSNGTPTTGTYQEAGAEPQDDGTHRIVMHDVTFDRYPDGQQTHPLFRDVARGRA